MDLIPVPGKGEGIKTSYSQDENYRAYKVFSMMDVDGGGSISLRELNRVLMGEVIRYVTCSFDHPDTGIIFGLDEENCVCITDIEPKSAASVFPFLIQRMRLHSINQFTVKLFDKKSLQSVYEELLKLHDEPLNMSFHEPMLIINKFSCALDVEFERELYSVMMPVGAIYSSKIFCKKIENSLHSLSKVLQSIRVDFDIHKRQISLHSESTPFKILFASGPNCRRSCRYSFGFSAEDTSLRKLHTGQPMLMNLNLGISQAKMEILMSELFEHFDRDGSGEFEFEEFRDFYIKYLDSEESLERLKQYALHRFRDVEREKFVMQQQHERKLKAERRKYLKKKNFQLIEGQKEKFKNNSYVDIFGNRRRRYRHRTLQTLKLESEDKPVNDSSSSSEQQEVNDTEPSKQLEQTERQEKYTEKRALNKKRLLVQAQRRRKIMQKIVESNLELRRKERNENAQHINDIVTTQLVELQYQIKRKLLGNVKLSNGILPSIGIGMDKIVSSPAIEVSEGILNNTYNPSPGLVSIRSVPSTVLHPAMMNYYGLREKHKDREECFNPEYMHPAFFTADYIRNNNRHSLVALSLVRVMKGYRAAGVKYRAERGILRSFALPPEEIIGQGCDNLLRDSNKLRRKKVKFDDMEVNQLNKPKSQSSLARLTLTSIKVANLKSSKRNMTGLLSPSVQLKSSSAHFTTEPYSLAGSKCEWINLDWVFRLNKRDELKFTVLNGMAPNNELLGVFEINANDVLGLPEDDEHLINLRGDISYDGGTAGNFEANIVIERGEDWDWFVQHCRDEQRKEKMIAAERTRYSKVSNIRKHLRDAIGFPCEIAIESFSLFDFPSGPSGIISLSAECGEKHFQSNGIKPNEDYEYYWDQLQWALVLPNPSSNLVICTRSRTVDARCIVTGFDVIMNSATIEREVSNTPQGEESTHSTFVIVGDVVNYGIKGSRDDSLNCKFALKGLIKHDSNNFNNIARHEVRDELQTVTTSLSLPSLLVVRDVELRLSLSFLQRLSTSISAIICKGVMSFKACLDITCGYRRFISPELELAEHAFAAEELTFRFSGQDWQLPIDHNMIVCFNICINGVNYGCARIFSNELEGLDLHNSSDGLTVTISRYVYSDLELIGKSLINTIIKKNGDTAAVLDMIQRDEPIISRVLEPEPHRSENLTNNKIIATSSIPRREALYSRKRNEETVPNTTLFHTTTNDADFPIRLVFVEVLLTDVRSTHIFKKNSLSVTLVAGASIFTTSKKKNAGRHSCWIDLQESLIVEKGDSVRICVKSNDSIVGESTLDSSDFIRARPNLTGLRDILIIFGTSQYPASGKGKLVYFMEFNTQLGVISTSIQPYKGCLKEENDRFSPSLQSDNAIATNFSQLSSVLINSAILKDILLPNLIVIYHVSFFDIPSVHYFGKNSPYLKLRYWSPIFGLVEYCSSTLINAGNFGKWVNLLWDVVIESLEFTVLFQVISDSILVGEAAVQGSQLLASTIPNHKGLVVIDVPLSLEATDDGNNVNRSSLSQDRQERGKLRLEFTTEPYVSPPDTLDYEKVIHLDVDDLSKKRSIEDYDEEFPLESNPSLCTSAIYDIKLEYISFHFVGRVRTKRPSPIESFVNIQLVCSNQTIACQLFEAKQDMFDIKEVNQNLSSLPFDTSFVAARVYSNDNHDVGTCSVEIQHYFERVSGQPLQVLAEGKVINSGGKLTGLLRFRMIINSMQKSNGHSYNLPFVAIVEKPLFDLKAVEARYDTVALKPCNNFIPNEPPFSVNIRRVTIIDPVLLKLMMNQDGIKSTAEFLSDWGGDITLHIEDSTSIIPILAYAASGNTAYFGSNNTMLLVSSESVILPVISYEDSWTLTLNINSKFAGAIMINAQDFMVNADGSHIEEENVNGCFTMEGLLRSRDLTCDGRVMLGSWQILFSFSPLSPVIPRIIAMNSGSINNFATATPLNRICNLTVLTLGVQQVPQYYSLFANSLHMIMTMGDFSFKTSSIEEAGDSAYWDCGSQCVIPIYKYSLGQDGPSMSLKLYSCNELLGSCEIGYKDLVEKMISSKSIVKMNICLLEMNGKSAGQVSLSFIGTEFCTTLDRLASEYAFNQEPSERVENFRLTLVQCIASDLMQVDKVLPNSPQVHFSYKAFNKGTEVIGYAGSYSTWLIPRLDSWKITVKTGDKSPLKITVVSNGLIVGYAILDISLLDSYSRDDNDMVTIASDLFIYNIENGAFITSGKVQLTFLIDLSAVLDKTTSDIAPPIIYKAPVSFKFPFTIVIVSAMLENFEYSNFRAANSVQLRISTTKSELWECSITTENHHALFWRNIFHSLALKTEDEYILFEICSRGKVYGGIRLKGHEFLSYRITKHGYVEVHSDIIDESRGRLFAKIKFKILLAQGLSYQENMALLSKINYQGKLSSEENADATCHIKIHLLSIQNLSIFHQKLSLVVNCGNYERRVTNLLNTHGTIIVNPEKWSTIPMSERSLLSFILYDNSNGSDETRAANKLGNVVFHYQSLVKSFRAESFKPSIQNGGRNIITKFTDLQFGVTKVAEFSFAYEVQAGNDVTVERSEEKSASNELSTVGESFIIPRLPSNLSNGLSFAINAIKATGLKPVHKFGKNSPLVTVEYLSKRYSPPSKPYAGSSAIWTDLKYVFGCRNGFTLHFTVSSASVVIGTCKINISELYLINADEEGRFQLKKELLKEKSVSGEVEIFFCILKPQEGYDHAYKITHGTSSGTSDEENFKIVPYRKVLSSPSKKENVDSKLRENLNAYHRLLDKGDMLDDVGSGRTINSLYTSDYDTSTYLSMSDTETPRSLLTRESSQLYSTDASTFIDINSFADQSSLQSYMASDISQSSYSSQISTCLRPQTSRGPLESDKIENFKQGDFLASDSQTTRTSKLVTESIDSHSLVTYGDFSQALVSASEITPRSRSLQTWQKENEDFYDSSFTPRSDVTFDSTIDTNSDTFSESSRPYQNQNDAVALVDKAPIIQNMNGSTKASNPVQYLRAANAFELGDEALLCAVQFCPSRNSTYSVHDRLATTFGTFFTRTIINKVVSSIIAFEIGSDYNPESFSLPVTLELRINLQNDEKIVLLESINVVKCIMSTGIVKAISHIMNQPDKDNKKFFLITSDASPPALQFTKRKAIMLAAGINESLTRSESKTLEGSLWSQFRFEKMIRNNREINIPLRAKLHIKDIIGIDLSAIDASVMPLKPFIVACKPYGNWYSETPIHKVNLHALTQEALVLNYHDLNTKYAWEPFVLRMGQCLVLDIRDANSGLIIAKGSIPYEDILHNNFNETQMEAIASVFLGFDIASEYGSGRTGGVIRLSIDLSVNIYKNSKKHASHWDLHRAQHWQNFPITPICFGIVRQKYREVAEDYDRQKLVHPAFFGFQVRFRGNDEDESRFKHPTFTNYSLLRKIVNPGGVFGHRSKGNVARKVNPFKWDATAASRGRCIICSTGLAGCPRCFVIPKNDRGVPFTPGEFAFDPEVEKEKEKLQRQKLIEIAAKRSRRLASIEWSKQDTPFDASRNAASLSDDISVDSSASALHSNLTEQIEEEYEKEKEMAVNMTKRKTIHTNLTTIKAIRQYRNEIQKYMVLYIKVLPAGYVKKLVLDGTDTIFQLYHHFKSTSRYGNEYESMIMLPTSRGLFELHQEMSIESDSFMADTRGLDQLKEFYLDNKGTSYVLLYIHKYHKESLPKLLQTFLVNNTRYSVDNLPIYSGIDRIPNPLHEDDMQKYLVTTLSDHYRMQQIEEIKTFKSLAASHARSVDITKMKVDKIKQVQKRDTAKLQREQQRRLDSHIKRFDVDSRQSAQRALEKREKSKRKTLALLVDEHEFRSPNDLRHKNTSSNDFGDCVSVSDVKFGDDKFDDFTEFSDDASNYTDDLDDSESEDNSSMSRIGESRSSSHYFQASKLSRDSSKRDKQAIICSPIDDSQDEVEAFSVVKQFKGSVEQLNSMVMQGSPASALMKNRLPDRPQSSMSDASASSENTSLRIASEFSEPMISSRSDYSYYTEDSHSSRSSYSSAKSRSVDSASDEDMSYSDSDDSTGSNESSSVSIHSQSTRDSSTSQMSSVLPINILQLHHYPTISSTNDHDEEDTVYDKDADFDDFSVSSLYSGKRLLKRECSDNSGIYSNKRDADNYDARSEGIASNDDISSECVEDDQSRISNSSRSDSTSTGMFTYRSNLSNNSHFVAASNPRWPPFHNLASARIQEENYSVSTASTVSSSSEKSSLLESSLKSASAQCFVTPDSNFLSTSNSLGRDSRHSSYLSSSSGQDSSYTDKTAESSSHSSTYISSQSYSVYPSVYTQSTASYTKRSTESSAGDMSAHLSLQDDSVTSIQPSTVADSPHLESGEYTSRRSSSTLSSRRSSKSSASKYY